jgi:hypothetical protein
VGGAGVRHCGHLDHPPDRPAADPIGFDQQRYEANFRFSLVRLRENAEGVALYRGEAGELANFRARFSDVIAIWWTKMLKTKQLGWFQSFYGQVAIIFPFLVASPRFFAGSMPLGGIFQIASAFGQVQGALSWFITAYSSFANWKATVDRLTSFTEALELARAQAGEAHGERLEGAEQALSLDRPRARPAAGQAAARGCQPSHQARGVRAHHRSVGRGQVDAVSRHRRHLAVLERKDQPSGRCAAAVPAATAVSADRHAKARGRLSRGCGQHDRRRGARGAERGGPGQACGRSRARRELGAAVLGRRAAAPGDSARAAEPAGLAASWTSRPHRCPTTRRPRSTNC